MAKHEWQDHEERGKAWATCNHCGRVGPPEFVRGLVNKEPDDCPGPPRATTEPEGAERTET